MDARITEWSTSTHDETNAGKGATTIDGHTNVDSGTAKWETSVKQDKDAGWPMTIPGNENVKAGTATRDASTQDDKNRGRETSGDEITDSKKAKWESSNKGNVDCKWGRPAMGNANTSSVLEDANTGSGKSARESARGDTNAVTAGQEDAKKGWGTTTEGNTDLDWNKSSRNSGSWCNPQKVAWTPSTQGSVKSGWGSPAEGNTGWGTTAEGNTGSGWNKSNGNSGSWGSSEKATWGPS